MITKLSSPYALRLPEDVKLKMSKIADSQERSLNGQIIIALKKYIETYEKEHGSINID